MNGGKDGKGNRGRSRSEVGKWRNVGGLEWGGGGWIEGKGRGKNVGRRVREGVVGGGVSWEMDGHSGGIGGKR